MFSSAFDHVCPSHGLPLVFETSAAGGFLHCEKGCCFPVVRDIPRFVPDDLYASSFGLQWNTFRKTQLDSYTGAPISEDRLARILGGLDWLKGKKVLEAGCGAGRFSEVLLKVIGEGMLQSLDLSCAVDAAKENCKGFSGHQICQADILAMPFRPESFDVVICIGVAQHTPNPEKTIAALSRMVRPGGRLFIDHYAPGYPMSFFRTKLRNYLLTKDSEYCMRFCTWLRNRLWPLHTKLHTLRNKLIWGKFYSLLCKISPLVDYQDAYPQLSQSILREWALLDMHDLLTDVYKHLRTTDQIAETLISLGLEIERCEYAGNGVEAAARRPPDNAGSGTI
jgi:ubiquinone/menaquinone biosynthesis C-methylase UbiE